MASELKVASGYTSVTRSGDTGVGWTTGGTLGTDDSNWATSQPYEAQIVDDAVVGYTAKNSPILRVSFGAFSLPVDEVVVSATLSVKHRQSGGDIVHGALVFENTGNTVTNQSDATVSVTLNPTSFTVSALNAGGATVDLLYKGQGDKPLLGLGDGIPTASVNYVTLSIATALPIVGGDPLSFSSISRIPSLGVN